MVTLYSKENMAHKGRAGRSCALCSRAQAAAYRAGRAHDQGKAGRVCARQAEGQGKGSRQAGRQGACACI